MTEKEYKKLTINTKSVEETLNVGAKIAVALKPGDIIGLTGELGAGKTCMVRGMARAMGLPENIPVLSPTFTIVNSYALNPELLHIDCYRLSNEEELHEIGIYDLMQNSAAVIEWYEKFPDYFRPTALKVHLLITGDNSRSITIYGEKRFFN